jgi:hypothetical protein
MNAQRVPDERSEPSMSDRATTPDGRDGEADGDAGMLHRYEAIHEHAELELELAGRAELEGLAALGERWEELTEGLPARPPAQALHLLERAKLIHERARIELYRVREKLLGEIEGNTRVRRAAEGYAGQLTRRPRLDRSA